MKYGIFSVFLLLCSSACYSEPNFSGTYNCQGFDPYINEYYSGTIRIIPQNAVYRLEMDYGPEDKAVGTAGLFDSETLSVVFQVTKDLKRIGLERYSYSPDHKKIQGYWVYLGKDKLGKEVCEKVSK